MSCFGLRLERPHSPHSHDSKLSSLPPCNLTPSSPSRHPFRRPKSLALKTSSSNNTPSLRLPIENLSVSKRHLVCIRRQPDHAPIHLSVGFKSRTGWQPLSNTRHNQDSLAVLLPLPHPLHQYALFAVYDGHGRRAHNLSAYVAETLATHVHALLIATPALPVQDVLRLACRRTSAAVQQHPGLDTMMTGTTAAVALVHGRTLTCANIGDSRIIVACQHDHKLVAVPLTRDHVPDCPIERTRIEQAGGRVESWSPDGIDTGPPRVWLKEKRLPGLSMSRAIGDDILRGILSSDAEVSRHELEEDDRFIVIATDGIWGVMSNEEVASYVAGRGQEPCQSIAESLVRYAASLWYKDPSESIDDISVIVVRLNWN